jgi:hypothetical protein
MFPKFKEFFRLFGALAKVQPYDAISERILQVAAQDIQGWFRHAVLDVTQTRSSIGDATHASLTEITITKHYNMRYVNIRLSHFLVFVVYFSAALSFIQPVVVIPFIIDWHKYIFYASFAAGVMSVICLMSTYLVVKIIERIIRSKIGHCAWLTVVAKTARDFGISSRSLPLATPGKAVGPGRFIWLLVGIAILSIGAFCSCSTFYRKLLVSILLNKEITIGIGGNQLQSGRAVSIFILLGMLVVVESISFVFLKFVDRKATRLLWNLVLYLAWLPRLVFCSSPFWFRVTLSWILAEMAVPASHLCIALFLDFEDTIDPLGPFLGLLILFLILSFAILVWALFSYCRPRFCVIFSFVISVSLGCFFAFMFFLSSYFLEGVL